jgi:hypothetical protein
MSSNPRNLNFLPPPPAATLTDSEMATKLAAEALGEGRLDLGFALARLAVQARQAEQSHAPILVPHLGSTRDEQPTATFEAVAGVTRAPGGDTDLNRCGVPCIIDSSPEACDVPVFWKPEANRWMHTLPALDDDHQARPQ